jgi:hypothetical protein
MEDSYTMAVVIPVLFSIAAQPTQNLPYFTKTWRRFRQAYNKDINDPCNNFTTRNVSLPVHPPRLNRHKQEPRGFILYLITRCTLELQMIHVCFQFYFFLGLTLFSWRETA